MLQLADSGIIRNLKSKCRKRLIRHVISLLDGKNTASTMIESASF